ncbi:MAG TPA: MarR family EPS-associated transcriptional regulator [Thermoanaerobaculia bacterium]|jgi:EPS-associated MarR family transcriptional regulator|nr:MarR family EPS-associated transcriptional regulator [Thermoanaerobaculia bacterium]
MNAGSSPPVSDEIRYRLLKYLADHPHASQRELARELGISLGKVNYCLRALVEKGWVKLRNFTNSDHKSVYTYVLTPRGVNEKVNATVAFLRRKVAEYDDVAKQIDALREELRAYENLAADAAAVPARSTRRSD